MEAPAVAPINTRLDLGGTMRTFATSIAALVACGSIAIAMCAMPAMAANGAVVLHDAGGTLFAADGSLFSTSNGCTYVANHAGHTLSSCHAQQPTSVANPSKAVIFNFSNTGVLCSANGVLTQNWQEVVTPNGSVSITCHGS
jgi:hypothetical protein